jgi:hypothetical protein
MSTQPSRLPQALGNIPAISTSGEGVAVVMSAEPPLVPLSLNLHWSIVLILFLLGGQLFSPLWALVQANWARKLSGEEKPMVLVAMYPTGWIALFLTAVLYPDAAWLAALFLLAGVIAYIIGLFSIKLAMEEYYNSTENIGLRLGGAMTFFFNVVYFQYPINGLARRKRMGILK